MAVNTKKRKKKNIKLPVGTVYIHTSFNNTIVTITDPQWNKITWWGTGTLWFKGTKQSTPYAAEMLTKGLITEAKNDFWLKQIGIVAKGLWLGRDGVFKAINDIGWIDIMWIKEATALQFGGCKGKRQKRN